MVNATGRASSSRQLLKRPLGVVRLSIVVSIDPGVDVAATR